MNQTQNTHVLMKHRLSMLVPYLETKGVTDIFINKPCEIILRFENGNEELISDKRLTLKRLLDMGRHLATHYNMVFNEENPILECKLPDPYGYRLQFDAYDSVDNGVGISIRLGAALLLPLSDFFNDDDCSKLREAIKNKTSILVIGETGSGKTTLCNSLIQEIPKQERVISVEDPEELTIKHINKKVLKMPRGGNFDGVITRILRHNPSRIIIGEIRDLNVSAYMSALNTGHSVIATLHANSAADTPNRIVQCMNTAPSSSISYQPSDVIDQLRSVGLIIEIEVHLMDGKLKREKPNLVWVKK